MTKPHITALIDTYNQGRFIEEAIESVLSQDYPRDLFEVIVVDDGSTDDTPQRVRRFGDRIQYIYKQNGGQASALNVGFAAARGEIIALLDGDDLWLPEKLRRVAETLKKDAQAVLLYHPFEYWNVARNLVSKDTAFQPISGDILADRSRLLRFGNLSTSGLAFRREALQKLLPVPEGLTILADVYLGYLAIFLGPVIGLNEHLTRYRVHGQNLCSFEQSSPQQLNRRAQCSAAVANSIRSWLEQNGYNVSDPQIAMYLRRHELVAERVGFTAHPPSRLQFARHVRAWNKVYAEMWSPLYQVFRAFQAAAGFVLGFRGFRRTEEFYRRANFAAFRERLFTAQASGLQWKDPVAEIQTK